MLEPNLIARCRVAAGLSQQALARLAGTSQPTLSAYERGAKSPSLAVTHRIVDAAGYTLELGPKLEFNQVPGQYGLHPFWLANRLWRLEPAAAFRTVVLPRHLVASGSPRVHLDKRADRARAFEILLREGQPTDLLDHVDGVLLVDLWGDLTLPDPIRRAWQPLISLALDGR